MYICLCESHTNTKKHTVSCVVLFCFPLFPSIDKYTQTRRLHSVLFDLLCLKWLSYRSHLHLHKHKNGARLWNARRHSFPVHFFFLVLGGLLLWLFCPPCSIVYWYEFAAAGFHAWLTVPGNWPRCHQADDQCFDRLRGTSARTKKKSCLVLIQ